MELWKNEMIKEQYNVHQLFISTHWSHDIVAMLDQHRNNIVWPGGTVIRLKMITFQTICSSSKNVMIASN